MARGVKAKAKVTAAKQPATSAKPSVTPARALSKDALRAAQAEKLERANAALRTKNREANRAAKLSAARMAELEGEVARLETERAAMSAQVQPAALPESGSSTRAQDHGRRAVIQRPREERHRDNEPVEEEEKVLAGRPDANMPALLTKDVQGG